MIRVLTLLALVSAPAFAETYCLKLRDLDFGEDQEKANDVLGDWDDWQSAVLRVPEEVEAYLGRGELSEVAAVRAQSAPVPPTGNVRRDRMRWSSIPFSDYDVAIRADDGESVSGVVDLVRASDASVVSCRFTFDPAQHDPVEEVRFAEVKRDSYWTVTQQTPVGRQWFLHLADKDRAPIRGSRFGQGDTIRFFTGVQAVSDNLALDRELLLGRRTWGGSANSRGSVDIPLSALEGVTVEAIDWSGMRGEGEVSVDPLAHYVPEDQHIVVFPSLDQLVTTMRVIEKEGAALVETASVRPHYRDLPGRYMAQMGVRFPGALAKMLPVESVAITGGDPYFPLGSDVAVLFESNDPGELFQLLKRTIAVQAKLAGADELEPLGQEGGDYAGYADPLRTFSSHLMRVGDLVVVANSRVQIERVLEVHRGNVPGLAGSDEYKVFRNRYPLAEMKTGYAFLSDACIRRWCGPRVRIGASRRIRAAVALKQLAAQQLTDGKLSDDYAPLLGEIAWNDGRVVSGNFGSLGFVRPISEMEMDTVTGVEADAYADWKSGYERGWRNVFDPIAVSFDLADDSRVVDLSVLPLIAQSKYDDFVEITRGARLSQRARSPHADAVMFASMAVNTEGGRFREFDQTLIDVLPSLKVNPLSWVGDSVTVFADKSPFWELVRAGYHPNGNGNGVDDLVQGLPLGVRIENKSSMKLAMVLTSLRAFVESSAPDAIQWETREAEDGRKYVVVSVDDGAQFEVFYAVTKSALLVSFNEELLQRAMVRETSVADNGSAVAAGDEVTDKAESIFLDGDLETILGLPTGRKTSLVDEGVRRRVSWSALPILNEWHQRFPEEDPVAVHARLFGEPLHCPGGKGFRWNAEEMTMESVAYGFPAKPRSEAVPVEVLERFDHISAGLSFDDGGLRAVAKLSVQPRPQVVGVIEPGGELLATAQDMLVTTVGARWEYQETAPFWGGTRNQTSVVQENVRSDAPGELLTRITREGEREGVSEVRWKLDGDARSLGWRNVDGSSGWNYSPNALMMPAELREGMRVIEKYRADGAEEDSLHYQEFEVLGLEHVEVPAGTYRYCLKVRASHWVGDEQAGSLYAKSVTTLWYFPGVGLVKTEGGAGSDYRWGRELTKFEPGEKE
ncbi:hypothetical protein [Sulfuriroseicoccus oceanibius]|uniref:Uncharacterized protein n=1 Tax=Sulfuriroseicoccus oceanibius TaxID=2707525 RepID=A0A6B3LDJ1_9BACT|nr:hypothetical protein [Sulfuriroseicoccus oceanibius]QQL44845.1 hypothetical protein G3M56_013350 [Sulfuriroseicoccus oceanibius]